MTDITDMINLEFLRNIMTVKQLSLYTGLSEKHIYKLIFNRKIPHYKPGGKVIYFKKEDVDDYLFKNRISSNDEIETEASKFLLKKKNLRR
ncbi:helix-turn-helix domain-containing protein [Chryseobacterium chendengshani]|uniref:helix-turn-helix domain-containing protein n=1 Tax=Chryseobacterium sp. LJ668 TaxID=2864040 RepID=UPI001C692182|nr:helix-turn-helix domain-containing protein [Chryseobacterium sp. LJ668]MBW8522156.1 helix-turn-helix domain-containing protein [Chryseobacterium sp. LJ668]QYK17803.1 helix-turn-helix domain-containing protein [Chryseobacterium sp. LJ668]